MWGWADFWRHRMTSTTEAAGGITLRKLMSAARAITGKRPDTQKAMAILAPYRDLDIIPGVEKNTSDAQLHLVAATVADCYRIEGEFREAAAWYRRASRFRPDGGHVHFYAEMVIEQEIDDHYEEALRCLRHSMATWRHRSIIVRAACWIWSFLLLIGKPGDFAEIRKQNRNAAAIEMALAKKLADSRAAP
jgi:tetratricopeptide (TPR) repeat protein